MITLMIVLIIVGLLGLAAFWDKVEEMIGFVFNVIFFVLSQTYDYIADKITN